MTTEQGFAKLKLSKPPHSGVENYRYLQEFWKQERLSSFKYYLRWCNNKGVVRTLKAMQKMIDFFLPDAKYGHVEIWLCFPELSQICPQKRTDAKLYQFIE